MPRPKKLQLIVEGSPRPKKIRAEHARRLYDFVAFTLRGLDSGHVTSKPVILHEGAHITSLHELARRALEP